MNLQTLLSPWMKVDAGSINILHIENDSRNVVPGSLFIAYPGSLTDGRKYLDNAVVNGAVAILIEPDGFVNTEQLSVPIFALPGLKDKLSAIAARFYQDPSKHLKVVGVTGTNGKTTIAYQLAQAHDLLQEKSAYIGTIGQGLVGKLKTLVNTTPDAICLQRLFHEYISYQVQTVSMEVSSHALCEGRANNITFIEAIFTNLSQEHLDYHKTMDEYAKAKSKLFAIPSLQRAIINIDDRYADVMLAACLDDCQIITYGLDERADYQAYACAYDISGCEFRVSSNYGDTLVKCKGVGAFNVYNSLAIFASLVVSGHAVSKVSKIISKLEPVAGRMELVAQKPYVFVDYSHTPDALENALNALVSLRVTSHSSAKIWVVFGCGGDRDSSKRSVMGEVASRFADFVIVTSDNPRTEDPQEIVDDILQGIKLSANVNVEVNRAEAIKQSLSRANYEDIILIAGKGHEDYQIIGTQKIHFSDKEIVYEHLRL